MEIEQLEIPLTKEEIGGTNTDNICRDGACTRPNDEAVIQQIQHHKQQIENIKTFLTNLDYKSREEKYEQKNRIQTTINQLDQTIMKLEAETQKLQDYQQQKTAFQTSLDNIQQQIAQAETTKKKLNADHDQLQQQLQSQPLETLKTQLQTVANFLQTVHDIQQLIADATANKNLIKDLQQQEKLLMNLYTILSKEILLIALDEYLPVLSEIINSFLVQVVAYQISMKITETAEKLELEAKIYDEKGEREVKSLSGGQRTILKLVRMLAISSYLHTPLLFLDETINNLDTETVGKVSEMLNNFVKQRTMKFYTVTHNTEIQEMDIWDSVVEV
jgi:DNA repair exonuclease SbcCD ATPase subunit